MPTVTLATSRSFESPAGTSILDAAGAAEVVLEHSCRTGRCGTCKARVLSGHTTVLRPEVSLTPDETAAGWILTCARAADGDVHLDLEDLAGLDGIRTVTLPSRVDAVARPAPDVVQVTLRLPPRSGFRFRAGQYVDVTGPSGQRRSYSIASDAAAPDRLELHVREVPGGALSAYWFGPIRPNDLLRFRGPMGTFYLRDVAGLDLVFLATGTGIAPIKSMLAELAALPAERRPASVALYWGGRVEADLYWPPTGALPGLRYVPVLSRADGAWEGARGHVQQVLLADRPALDRSVVYACGSEAMIASARTALLAAGLPARRFHSDAFVRSDA